MREMVLYLFCLNYNLKSRIFLYLQGETRNTVNTPWGILNGEPQITQITQIKNDSIETHRQRIKGMENVERDSQTYA
ncbi:MAG: hypothetical protein P4L49_14305, partial [Desulfosporosinus sp.]|nr:hypothetical protein [Desulfosporosinus sp.]